MFFLRFSRFSNEKFARAKAILCNGLPMNTVFFADDVVDRTSDMTIANQFRYLADALFGFFGGRFDAAWLARPDITRAMIRFRLASIHARSLSRLAWTGKTGPISGEVRSEPFRDWQHGLEKPLIHFDPALHGQMAALA